MGAEIHHLTQEIIQLNKKVGEIEGTLPVLVDLYKNQTKILEGIAAQQVVSNQLVQRVLDLESRERERDKVVADIDKRTTVNTTKLLLASALVITVLGYTVKKAFFP